ncbi:MAG: High-affinity zinc uptake system binding-protein ZnuA precursor [Tenericutes bacterium ADurb.Bin239]|nr:metal ABC transporter substrate-binding protein [Bacillota bacterium]OQA79048.1 MAG: High-affinity zinc uptake system binding-protein ZnuA precursor [Tenericutes bacterium ADurb.Bin239]
MKHKTLLLLSLLVLSGCNNARNPNIVVTSFVGYDAVLNIVGDKIDVKNILPWGSELHDFEPTPRDVAAINNAKLFVYTSPELDTWVKSLVTNENSFNMSEWAIIEELIEDSDNHSHNHNHDSLHFWTDPLIHVRVMSNLLNVISDIFPANSAYFTDNYDAYTEELLTLENELQTFLNQIEDPTIFFAGHNALSYFADHFNMTIKTINESYKPDVDFVSQEIIDFINEIKTANVHYLFIEELVEPRVANLIKNELAKENYDITLLELHGYHNITAQQAKENVTYADLFAQNIANIKQAFSD